MAKYLIEQKIKTLSDLNVGIDENTISPEMNIEGFIFYQWDFSIRDGWRGGAWLVRKEIEADSAIQALNTFRSKLDKIVQKVGFVSQCYMDFYKEPFLVYRLNDNSDKVFFYKHIQDRGSVGLHFDNQELDTYEKISNFKYPEVFRFLQECRNAIGYIPRLLLLFSALEAMCGKKEMENSEGKPYITYDKDEMIRILGKNLYNEIFGPNGIRHKLNHGEMVESIAQKNYIDDIYISIIKYFNKNLDSQIDESVISPQRHFYDNYEFVNLWLKPDDFFEINLKNCIDNFENHRVVDCEDVYGFDIEKY